MDFSAHNPSTSNALNVAARNNCYKTVRRLLKEINPNTVDNRGWTSVHEAAHNDSFKSLVLILKHKLCRPLVETHEGHTALYLACRNKASIETIKLLLNKVHDIANFGSTEGVAPLHIASSQGRVELIQLLIDYGALINVQDFDGDTPLHDAVLSVQYEAVMILLHAGADASIANSCGYTPFHLAASKGNYPIISSILPFVTKINRLTTAGHTAFMLSVLGDNIEIIDLLLEHGANPYLKDAKGNMALDIALIHGCEKIFCKIFSIMGPNKANKNLIVNACKPHYYKTKVLKLLLNSDIGPEYFDFDEEFNLDENDSKKHYLFYTKNAPLNTYLNICEYLYTISSELFLEFFLLFLMRGVDTNAASYDECPPLVYIQYRPHQNCFKSVLEVLIEYGCNVDYCSCPKRDNNVHRKDCIPDAFHVALHLDSSIIRIMLPYSLYCDPGFLLQRAYVNKMLNSLHRTLYVFLLEATDDASLIKIITAKSMPSLKKLCRYTIRQTIKNARTYRLKRTTEFLNIINSLPLPQSMCDYLRFM